MATQLLYLMNMIIIKQLNKVKTPKILNVCCINHSVLYAFIQCPGYLPGGKSQPFRFQDGFLGLQEALLWLSSPLLSHWIYLEKVSLTPEVAFKPFTIGLCTKRTLNGCQNAGRIERLNTGEPIHQDFIAQTYLEFPSSEAWMFGCSRRTSPLPALWHPQVQGECALQLFFPLINFLQHLTMNILVLPHCEPQKTSLQTHRKTAR